MTEPILHPWEKGHRSYAGWVPNVRSHLSFSLIGAVGGASSFTQAIVGGPTRLVLVLARRVVNDFPVWGWLAVRLWPGIEQHWYMDAETASVKIPVQRDGVLCVEQDRQGALEGTLRLLPRQETAKKHRSMKEELGGLHKLLATHRSMQTGDEVRKLRSDGAAMAAAGLSIVLHFSLMRTGECRIWYEAQVVGMSERDHDWVAEQAYFFVKDTVHAHTHHDASSDQITPLTRFDPDATEPGHEDEVAWRRQTLWSLSREVERLNRDGGLVDQRRALGFIAYAEAFQASLMSHVRDGSAPDGFRASTNVHDFDFTHLKDSVKASIEVAGTRLAQRVQMWIAGVATFISSVALVSSLVSTHNAALPRDKDGLILDAVPLGAADGLLPWLAAEPLVTGMIAMILFLGVIAYFLADGGAGLYNGVQRTLSQFARATSVTVAASPRAQWIVTLMLHFLYVTVAFGMAIGTVLIISWGAST